MTMSLLQAAQNGDWAEITRLCSEGIDVNESLDYEYAFDGNITVLSEASKHGHIECVQKLLEMGAGEDVKYHTMNPYRFAVEMAAVGGKLECLRFLVESRLFKFKAARDNAKYSEFIDLSRKGDFDQIQKLLVGNMDKDIVFGWKGNSLMSLFVVNGCLPSCLQVLIDQGVDVNGVDYNGFTPLLIAVLSDNVECVRFLLMIGVNINSTAIDMLSYFLEDGKITEPDPVEIRMGTTALMYASCLRNSECLREILEASSKDDVDYNMHPRTWTALAFASYYGNVDSVRLLLNSGASVDGYDQISYHNIHHWSMMHGHADCLELTMAAATRTKLWDWMMGRHLDICVSDVRCLRILLKYVDDVNMCASEEETFLTEAASNGFVDSVRLLLGEGAAINVPNDHGQTALMFSCDDQREELFDLLIKMGADVDIKDEWGCTAIEYAKRNNAVKCFDKLKSLGAKYSHQE